MDTNPALKRLANLVPNLLAASRTPSSLKGYHAHSLRWKAWAATFPEVTNFPAPDGHFSLYLNSLVLSGYLVSTINSAFYGIRFFHNSCGVPNPCDSNLLDLVWKAAKDFLQLYCT